MPVIALVNSKGGCGKSTAARCLAYSRTFRKAYKRIALVELDPQGTLSAWFDERSGAGDVTFAHVHSESKTTLTRTLERIDKAHDCLILDVPGESQARFSTGLAVGAADMIIVPMRSSTDDEQSFGDHLLPILRDYSSKVFILPAFVHPNANQAKMKEYFDAIMPDGIRTLKHCLPNRGVFENYSRDGLTLDEYAASVKGNARDYRQAQAAIQDVERIAGEIVKYGKA